MGPGDNAGPCLFCLPRNERKTRLSLLPIAFRTREKVSRLSGTKLCLDVTDEGAAAGSDLGLSRIRAKSFGASAPSLLAPPRRAPTFSPDANGIKEEEKAPPEPKG